MRDRGAEGAVLGALGVDVDPLVVVGRVGEEADALLRDLDPVGPAEVGAGEAGNEGPWWPVTTAMRSAIWPRSSRRRTARAC